MARARVEETSRKVSNWATRSGLPQNFIWAMNSGRCQNVCSGTISSGGQQTTEKEHSLIICLSIFTFPFSDWYKTKQNPKAGGLIEQLLTIADDEENDHDFKIVFDFLQL